MLVRASPRFYLLPADGRNRRPLNRVLFGSLDLYRVAALTETCPLSIHTLAIEIDIRFNLSVITNLCSCLFQLYLCGYSCYTMNKNVKIYVCV